MIQMVGATAKKRRRRKDEREKVWKTSWRGVETNLRTGKIYTTNTRDSGVLISNGRTMKAGEFKKCNITEYINAR